MADQLLPADLRAFLTTHIDSIAQLEALLLVHASPDAVWDAQSMSKRLYISEQEARETLEHLARYGLIAPEPNGYRYAPQSDQLATTTDLLADQYKRHLIPITNLIHAKPRRIRQFADAFKMKKD